MLAKCLKNFLLPNAKDVSVHDIHKLKEQGLTSVMYSFFLTYVSHGLKRRKDFALKIYKEGFEEHEPTEFSVLKTLKEHNLRVPTVYSFQADNGIMEKPFIIMEKIEGKSATHYLNDEIKGQIIVDEMAKILSEIHKLDPHGIPAYKFLREQYELERQVLMEMKFFIKNCCMNFLGFSPLRQRRFIAAVKQLEEEKQEKFHDAILHMDYEPNHVLISNGRFIIVDWGNAIIGDPAFDVGWAYHLLRLGRETFEADLGEYFVKSYEKYMGQRIVNLQFWKDMGALKLASYSGLSPFKNSKFLNYGELIDLNFGYVYGKFREAIYLHRMQRIMSNNHNAILSNFDYLQNYVIEYLERGR